MASVTTDNNPVHYDYISRRLTREIVQQHEAARPKSRFWASLRLPFLSLGFQGVSPDFRNRYDLAMRATVAVKDNTGTIDSPGAYVAATMKMKRCKVVFHLGFETSGAQEVAAFFADETAPDIGRVFVVLLGSVTNFTGWRAAKKLETDSCPSDAAGMYQILNATLEPRDSKVDAEYLAMDLGDEPLSVLDAAYRLVYRDESALKCQDTYAFLAIKHRCDFDVSIFEYHYDVALLGAPVWVTSPPPRPLGT